MADCKTKVQGAIQFLLLSSKAHPVPSLGLLIPQAVLPAPQHRNNERNANGSLIGEWTGSC